jgi:hypothetical protein
MEEHPMSVSRKDRDDYQEGRRDHDKNLFDQVMIDVVHNHPDSSAYDKGRSGEQLDGDKNDE